MPTTPMLPSILQGTVTRFKGDGRRIGYPTANIAAETGLADGIYFGFASLAEHAGQPALIFLGKPLTLEQPERRVEAHLLDIPDRDFYGQKLTVRICHFHRENRQFDSLEALLATIRADEAAARIWFSTRP